MYTYIHSYRYLIMEKEGMQQANRAIDQHGKDLGNTIDYKPYSYIFSKSEIKA